MTARPRVWLTPEGSAAEVLARIVAITSAETPLPSREQVEAALQEVMEREEALHALAGDTWCDKHNEWSPYGKGCRLCGGPFSFDGLFARDVQMKDMSQVPTWVLPAVAPHGSVSQ